MWKYHVTPETIAYLKAEGYDLWTISLWETWLGQMPRLQKAKERIRGAFRDVRLKDGMGLREADAIDDYADPEVIEAARKLDEDTYWNEIDVDLLNYCYAAPVFFDPQGFVFHLPAFLLADLNDECDHDFIHHLIEKHPSSTEWITLLGTEQKLALIEVLDLLRLHPDYYGEQTAFDKAIARLTP